MRYFYNATSDFQKELEKLQREADALSTKATKNDQEKSKILEECEQKIRALEALEKQIPSGSKVKVSTRIVVDRYEKIQNLLKK